MDNRILALAAGIQKVQPKNPTILVSKDINLRIKADALGLRASAVAHGCEELVAAEAVVLNYLKAERIDAKGYARRKMNAANASTSAGATIETLTFRAKR